MKTLNKTKLFLLPLLLVAITACEKDGEKIYLSELETNKLIATANKVELSQDNSKEQVLSLSWTAQALTVSNPEMKAPDIIATSMQISTQQDFSSNIMETVESNLSKAYTGSELNTVAKNLGLQPDVATSLYFRLKSSVGNNMTPVFSNVLAIDISPYLIDMSIGFILDGKRADTGRTLYSSASDGVYTGFMGAASWYNFFMREGDGSIWGNDAATGTPFILSSADDSWNCWFPEPGGCYYVTMDVNKKQWSALYLPELTISGDISGTMTFDRPNVKWTYTFNAASTNPIKIKLSAAGNLYNSTTSDKSSVSGSVAFAQQSAGITLAQQASDITVAVPSTGECTLTFDLSNPKKWTCTVAAGSIRPVAPPQYLYVPGIDDGITGGDWTFDNFLTLYDEDALAYAGVINVNSLWGYSFNIEKDNWNDKYTYSEGDAYSGTLVFQGSNNIPAPAAGLYLIDVSMKGLTYNLINVGDQIHVYGLNDDWDSGTILSTTETQGVYTGEITIHAASPWGFQIHLDGSWLHYFGGSAGKLYYKGSNITDDASLSPGVYQLTVDLLHGTYLIKN